MPAAREIFLAPECANASLASLPCALGGLRVKNIQVGEMPPEARLNKAASRPAPKDGR
jgi:hypothetical protein